MTVGRLLDLSETVSSFVKKEKECLPRAIAMVMKWAESIVEKHSYCYLPNTQKLALTQKVERNLFDTNSTSNFTPQQ